MHKNATLLNVNADIEFKSARGMININSDIGSLFLPLFFVVGAFLGSMFTIFTFRIPRQLAISKKNVCRNCNSVLKVKELIPILSFLFLGGKCKHCKAKISRQYIIIEILTALAFVFLYMFYGMSFDLLLYLTLWSMLIITFVIDLEHMVISDAVLFASLPVVVVYILATDASWLNHLLGLIIGFTIFLMIYLAAKWFYGKEAFGFGDVMLSGAVGAFLGWDNILLVTILSFVIAVVVIVFLRAIGKKLKREMEIPFGPFICVAAAIASLYGYEIIQFYWGLGSL